MRSPLDGAAVFDVKITSAPAIVDKRCAATIDVRPLINLRSASEITWPSSRTPTARALSPE